MIKVGRILFPPMRTSSFAKHVWEFIASFVVDVALQSGVEVELHSTSHSQSTSTPSTP